MPSSAADAAGLLASAIDDPNPVVFVENNSLYFRREPEPADHTGPVPIGSARTVRRGGDVTIIATSRMVGEALAGRRAAGREGVQAEVIDPRTLVPLDVDTIAASVRRTGRAVVAHEAVTTGGFGAELAARIQQEAFDCLEAPIQRVGAPFTPVPVSPPLEDAYRPGRRQTSTRRRGSRSSGTGRRGEARSLALARGSARALCGSAISDAPGNRSSTSRWRSTISRLVSAIRACSRASASARAPWRRSIASISPW